MSLRRRGLVAVGLAGLLVGSAWVRVAVDGYAEAGRAAGAEAASDWERAILHHGRAARWRAPLVGHDEESLEALGALAEAAEARGEAELALRAHRERRRALLATRTFAGVKDPAALEASNAAIARLMGATSGSPSNLEAALSAATPGPTPGRFWASLLFVAWLGAGSGLVLRGLDARGRWRRAAATRWGLACLLLALGWMWATLRG